MSTSLSISPEILEENYARWKADPKSVEESWSVFFEGFELGSARQKGDAAATGDVSLQTRVDGLVYAYRTLGHTVARLDPLTEDRPEQPLLSLRELGFEEKDLDLLVSSKFFLRG